MWDNLRDGLRYCGMHAFVSVLGRRAGTEGADNRTGSDVRTCGCAVGCRAFQLRNIEAVTCVKAQAGRPRS